MLAAPVHRSRTVNRTRAARGGWARGWLLAGALFLALACTEAILRGVLGNLQVAPYQVDPGDGRCVGLQPGGAVRYTGWWRRVPAVIHEANALGYRGPARPRSLSASPESFPGSSTQRILMLGDSLVYGQALPADQALPAQLERILDRRVPGVEVLNFGIPGLNIEELRDQYLDFASRWTHERAILLLNRNDLDRPLCDLLAHRGRVWALRHLYLFRLWTVAVGRGALPPDPGRAANGAERLDQALGAMADAARSHGASLHLVALEGDEITQGLGTSLSMLASAHHFPYLNLATCPPPPGPPLPGQGGFVPPEIPGEGHFNAEGNAMIAGCIASWLEDPRAFAARVDAVLLGSGAL